MTRWLILMAGLMLAGCNNPHGLLSNVRSTGMGPGQYMVACVDSPMNCAREANRLCPVGFDVTSNTTNAADYGRMTMIIRCR